MLRDVPGTDSTTTKKYYVHDFVAGGFRKDVVKIEILPSGTRMRQSASREILEFI